MCWKEAERQICFRKFILIQVRSLWSKHARVHLYGQISRIFSHLKEQEKVMLEVITVEQEQKAPGNEEIIQLLKAEAVSTPQLPF